MWSYIPYTAYISSKPDVAFHPAFWKAAVQRLRPQLFQTFQWNSMQKHKFLQLLFEGILKHPNATSAYEIILDSFGHPLFRIRNLAHTQQNPLDRMVYVIHLEDSLHSWRNQKEDSVCWEGWIALGIAGLMAIGMTFFLQNTVPVPMPSPISGALYPFA